MGDRNSRIDLSLREAENILEGARSKDYWGVDDYYDNRAQLQDAIDVVYNTIPGNDYEVDYMENQNGTRLMVRCKPCSKELLSYDPFHTHEKGKPHNKIRMQQLEPKDPNLTGPLQRKHLNITKEIFPRKSLEDYIDYCKDPILGVQFVYKAVVSDRERFTCCLCIHDDDVTSISKKQMLKHLSSRSHNIRYMKVKFGYKKQGNGHFTDDVRAYEEMEGKIHAPIIDFTKHQFTKLPKRKIKKEKRTRHRHQSGSSSSSSDRSKKPRLSSPVKIKQEKLTPENSPRHQVVEAQAMPVKAEKKDLRTSLKILENREALEKIMSDDDMKRMLHQYLLACNNKLIKIFRSTNAICYNEKFEVVAEAAACAENLVKHLDQLQIV